MPSIMADHDVEGHLRILLSIWSSPKWADIWQDTHCDIESFTRLSIEPTASDEEVWCLCQERGIILITGNRNAEGVDSLEITIRRRGTPRSLPVLTIADPDRLSKDWRYAEDVAAQALDYVRDIENMRGAGRLYLH
jgi:hypothetical protein